MTSLVLRQRVHERRLFHVVPRSFELRGKPRRLDQRVRGGVAVGRRRDKIELLAQRVEVFACARGSLFRRVDLRVV